MNRVSILLAVLVSGVASCGESQAKTEHNDADVSFARAAIADHQVSIETVKLALPRINSPDVRELAEKVQSAQEEGLEALEKLQEEWGLHQEGAPASLSPEERHHLEQAEGVELDQAFLRAMIEHRKKAVKATQAVLRDGKSKEAKKLAHELLRAQEREIEEMEKELVGA